MMFGGGGGGGELILGSHIFSKVLPIILTKSAYSNYSLGFTRTRQELT